MFQVNNKDFRIRNVKDKVNSKNGVRMYVGMITGLHILGGGVVLTGFYDISF